MATELITGKWYRWTGPKTRIYGWNGSGEMDFMLDGKPHVCSYGFGEYGKFQDSPDPGFEWQWIGIKYMEEVKQDSKRRPTVGDTARVVAGQKFKHGDIGKIIADDHGDMPYKLLVGEKDLWVREGWVELVTSPVPMLKIEFKKPGKEEPLEFQSLDEIRRSIVSEIDLH
jgi:hypothetical protein